jgi:UDP-glucose 4-epimerase
MRVIILGHSGFIGSKISTFLKSTSDYEIIGCSLPDFDLTDWTSTKKISSYLSGDVALIYASAMKRQAGDRLEAFISNISMTTNVCRLLTEFQVGRLIYFSSAAVYGEDVNNIDITEATLLRPSSYYGIAKLASECLLQKTCIDNRIENFIALRPPLIYGLGDAGLDYGPSGFYDKAKKGESIVLWGDGKENREFIYIDDISRILEKMLYANFFGPLNIASGVAYKFSNIVDILREKFPEVSYASRERTKLKVDNTFNPELLRIQLGNNFQFTPLDEGIKKMIDQSV